MCVDYAPRGAMHRERRRYLRSALNELNQLLGDSPGLRGPQVHIFCVSNSGVQYRIFPITIIMHNIS